MKGPAIVAAGPFQRSETSPSTMSAAVTRAAVISQSYPQQELSLGAPQKWRGHSSPLYVGHDLDHLQLAAGWIRDGSSHLDYFGSIRNSEPVRLAHKNRA